MPRERTIQDRERDMEALQLKRRGLPLHQIATQLGWAGPPGAHAAIRRALKDCYAPERDDAIIMETERLDDVLRTLYRVMMSRHVMVSHGKIMRDPKTLEPLYDDAVNVQAAQAIVRASESLRKLHGLDAPTRSRVQVITDDDLDQEYKKLLDEIADLEAEEAQSADADTGVA
ncbi:MAG TPA: hypothetical protein VFQ44_01810 [Streptosporangiaceae bacterium]|nr:hypothetical protein [Streptosporangiaceae bacterium]